MSKSVNALQAFRMGCGIDLVELKRFRAAMRRGGRRFVDRIFTATEQRYAASRATQAQRLAARFAVKEATIKALAQVDPTNVLAMKQIEVRNDAAGRPSVSVEGWRGLMPELHISLSHTEQLAVACVIAIRR